MGKFIVIKEEDWGILSRQVLVLPESTELSTDESIDERAKEYFLKRDKEITDRDVYGFHHDSTIHELMAEFATEQSLIEQMKAKEFAEWCSINGWFFYTKDNLWRKHGNGGFEYKTTEQLFNQFTNQKQ